MKRAPFMMVLLALLLSACAPKATPTTDPAQIQASAVAAANTMVALTQGAVPTETPVPPTPPPSPTPLPSPTLLALPTLSIATMPTQVLQPGGGTTSSGTGGNSTDPCNAPMSPKPEGPQVTVRIVNASGGAVVVSVWLTAKNDFGECGYRGFNLTSNGSITTTLPTGCYGAGAFVTTKKTQYRAFGNGCFKSALAGTVTVDKTSIIKVSQ